MVASVGFGLWSVQPLSAQEAETGAGIRFISAPSPGHSGPRITIQITPEEHLRNSTPPIPEALPVLITQPEEAAPPAALGAALPWFWAEISPGLPADPGRFWAAQELLARAPEAADLSVPRLATLHEIIESHGTDILRASLETQVSPALILAVMAVESAGRVDAISHAGAQGLMQLIPATAARFGVANSADPAQNIKGGVAYLDWLMGQFDRDPVMVLAAYNAGEGAVAANDGVPPYAETRDYVPKVLAAWVVAQGLCTTPPMLVTDPCVFKVLSAGG
jgi:hypothetical protein